MHKTDDMINSAAALLERAAQKFPESIAFEDKDNSITFAALRYKSRSVGSALLKRAETGAKNPVVIFLPKSIDAVISFIGVMYAASPYAPVNYAAPTARIETIINNLKPSAVITDREGYEKLSPLGLDTKLLLFEELAGTECDEDAVSRSLMSVCDLDPSYIMHTSGSTGVPKGVTISCRGVIDYAEWIEETFGINSSDIIGLNSPFHFDNSIFDVYTTLLTGAKTIIIPEVLFMYPDKLMEFVAEKEITCIFWVPTVMISVANSGVLDKISLPKLKNILFAGEVMPNKQLNIWRRALPDSTYTNMYGPTETNVCTYYIVDRDFADSDPLPIGKACENLRVVILNEDNKLCKEGEEGEICISASGRSLEYWNAPELSAKAFVQNPLNTKYYDKIYRTGDIGYKAKDGNIMFMGRRDSQIKLRGNRIELGDVETAAVNMENTDSACALFDAQKQEIVLFVESGAEIIPRRYRNELKNYLPPYMVPARIVVMKSFPHTPTGKIDRVKLRKEYIEQ